MHLGSCLSPVERQCGASASPRCERVFHPPGPSVVVVVVVSRWRIERVLRRIERGTVEVEVETYCEG